MVRNCAPENLEIPGLVLTHHPGMTVEDEALTKSSRNAAVDGEDHARRIARAIRRQKRHQVPDLARVRRPAERQSLLEFLVAVLVAELMLGARLEQGDVTVGADRARIDADHANVIGKALAAERASEGHQRGV